MKKRFKVLAIFISIVLIALSCNFGYMTKAVENKPDIKVSVATNKYNLKQGESFEVKYTFEPQPIKFEDINKKQPKDIVLVIDTSGSMRANLGNGTSKITALKNAAKAFINKFRYEDNIRIAIVDYGMRAYAYQSRYDNSYLMSTKVYSNELNYIIDYRLIADGGTNIGDGIRGAQNILRNSPNKKYVIVMSDGMPTAFNYIGAGGRSYDGVESQQSITEKNLPYFWCYSWGDNFASNNTVWTYRWYDRGRWNYNNYEWNYYDRPENNYNDFKIGTYSNTDPNNYCLNYAKLMAAKFKELDITNYMIGFSSEADQSKLTDIAASGGGTYYDAKSEDAITEVYNELADKIKTDYTIEGSTFSFKLPDGIEYSGQYALGKDGDGGDVINLPSISYKLNDAKTQYEAKPFDIILKLKVMKEGNYSLGSDSNWNVRYKGLNNTDIKIFLPRVNVIVNNFKLDFDLTKRIITSDLNNLLAGEEYEIEYTVTPKDIKMYYDTRPKEIILVVDTSGSMEWRLRDRNYPSNRKDSRMEIAKVALNKFVDKFKDSPNTKISIISYNDSVNMVKFSNNSYMIDANRTSELKEAIKTLTAGGGTNIGEGVRQGLWLLNQNSNSRKYMVVMSDGEASTYTVPRGNDMVYYETLDNKNGVLLQSNENNPPWHHRELDNFYRYDWQKGFEYSKIMAGKLKGYDAKTFAIGFSKEAGVDKLKSIAQEAGGKFMDATEDDSSAIERVYNDIAEEILSDINVDNVKFSDQLPEGFTFVNEGTSGIVSNLSFNYKHKGNGVFGAEPITLKYKIRANKVGKYDLDKTVLEYKETINGEVKTHPFNKLSITVKDDVKVRQGLFTNNESDVIQELAGDKYLLRNSDGSIKDNINIGNETTTTLAALIGSKGSSNNVVIKIQKPDEVNITNLNYTLYKVGTGGELIEISKGTSSSTEINLNIAKENNINYLVKYSFVSKSNDDANVKTINTKVIVNGQDSNTSIYLNILGKPDLF